MISIKCTKSRNNYYWNWNWWYIWINCKRRIRKVDKSHGDKLHFKDVKFPVKVSNIHKIERKNSVEISVFGYEDIKKYPIYLSKLLWR